MLDAKSTRYSLFSVGVGSNDGEPSYPGGWYLFDYANANWSNFIVLTTDTLYPYKTSYLSKAAYGSFYWLTNSTTVSGRIGVGYGSTISILGEKPIRFCTSWWLVSPEVISSYGCSNIIGYGIPTTKVSTSLTNYSMTPKRVFWCEDNWKLRTTPNSSCQLSSDNKIASCPTTIENQFLCTP